MKQQIIDRFSKTGRLRTRLEEIELQVANREIPRMDGGDLIGRHIVANLLALPTRSPEESRLMFEAQRIRATLYQASSGATALEAAEALSEARAAAAELGSAREECASLVEPAWAILQDLLKIGSRRNAWICFNVLFDAIEGSQSHDELRSKVIQLFTGVADELVAGSRDPEILDVLLKMCDWTRTYVPDDFPALVRLIPSLLAENMDAVTPESAIRAYLYARHLCLGTDGDTLERLVMRLIDAGMTGAEARSVYNEYLASFGERAAELESAFESLAYVNPAVDIRHDADLESLNVLLTDHFQDRPWVWRNRALMLRRRGDVIGALTCLARAMSISGEPPELMGLLSPVLAGFGFLGTAHQFSRFLPAEMRTRFRLESLDLLAAQPGTAKGKLRLAKLLGELEECHDLPREFRPHILAKQGQLLFEVGENRPAGALFARILRENPSDEMAAIRLAEVSFRFDDFKRAQSYLGGTFSARTQPIVSHVRSRLAEAMGNIAEARELNEAALAMLERAQEAGREVKEKAIATLGESIRRTLGAEYVQCALMAMLEMEAFAQNHRDLDLLEPVLERRAVSLAMKLGDVDSARSVIRDLVMKHPADTEVFVVGIRASLDAGQLDEALEFIEKAEDSGRAESAEIPLLRGLVYARRGDFDLAEEWIARSIDRVPTAEARLVLATLRMEDGRHDDAIEMLCGFREEEGGTPAIRARLFDLAGRLLERSGKVDEALEWYERSIESVEGWSEAHRRTGVLLIEATLQSDAPDGRERLHRGLQLLEGFNDPDAVTRSALARAALAPTPREAVGVIVGALKRTAGRNLRRLQLARARYLAMAANDAELHQVLTELLEEDLPVNTRRSLASSLAAVKRRLAARALCTAKDVEGISEALTLIDDAAENSSSAPFEAVAVSLRRAAGHEVAAPESKKNNPEGQVVLAALVHGMQSLAEGPARRVRNAAERQDDAPVALAAGLAVALSEGEPGAILTAIDRLERSGYSAPFSRVDLLRKVAATAVAVDDMEALDRAMELTPGQLEDVRLYRRLLAVLETRSADEDTAVVLGLLTELERSTSSGGTEDPALGDRLRSIRNRITSLKETPSPAWASARMRTAGKRSRIHVPAVHAFWKRMAEDSDLAGIAGHNVALMDLAAAHEAEAAGIPAEEMWRAAHESWGRLCLSDDFWQLLADEHGGVEASESLRRKVPTWLLEAQLSQARRCVKNGDFAGAVGHGRVVAASPLIAYADGERLRDELFSALSSGLEKNLHNGRLDDAMHCIDRVIVADSGNPTARREMIRVAALALGKTLDVFGALTSEPEESMVLETCSILARVLSVAERCVRDLLDDGTQNPDTARDLGICTRALAFVTVNRHHDSKGAAQLVDRAIEICETVGVDTQKLRRVRSEIGLEMVERKMSSAKTTAQIAVACPDDPIEQALAEVERLLGLDPDNTRVVTQKARILLASNRDEEAEEVARDLFRSAQENADPATVRSAVELLHQVQSERERIRYEGRMEVVERMVDQRNWRAALDVFTEAIVGRENESLHLVKHVELLLGLRKLDRAEQVIEQLADCAEEKEQHTSFVAELACIRRMSDLGGDVQSAFDLFDRGEFDRAVDVIDDVLDADDRAAPAQFLAALANAAGGRHERAQAHAAAAMRCGAAEDRAWMSVIFTNKGIAS